MPAPKSGSRSPLGKEPSSTAQSVVSLLLILHLFCVFVALTSYTRTASLQARVLQIVNPYTRTVGIAPDIAPYYLTRYDANSAEFAQDDEHYLEFEFVGSDGKSQIESLNEAVAAYPDLRRRYRNLASHISSRIDNQQADERAETLIRSAASFAMRHYDTDHGVLRVKHHMSQPRRLIDLQKDFPPDPLDDKYKVVEFEADVILAEDGDVLLVKREKQSEVAPVLKDKQP